MLMLLLLLLVFDQAMGMQDGGLIGEAADERMRSWSAPLVMLLCFEAFFCLRSEPRFEGAPYLSLLTLFVALGWREGMLVREADLF